jgi:hypothetical protein
MQVRGDARGGVFKQRTLWDGWDCGRGHLHLSNVGANFTSSLHTDSESGFRVASKLHWRSCSVGASWVLCASSVNMRLCSLGAISRFPGPGLVAIEVLGDTVVPQLRSHSYLGSGSVGPVVTQVCGAPVVQPSWSSECTGSGSAGPVATLVCDALVVLSLCSR